MLDANHLPAPLPVVRWSPAVAAGQLPCHAAELAGLQKFQEPRLLCSPPPLQQATFSVTGQNRARYVGSLVQQ